MGISCEVGVVSTDLRASNLKVFPVRYKESLRNLFLLANLPLLVMLKFDRL